VTLFLTIFLSFHPLFYLNTVHAQETIDGVVLVLVIGAGRWTGMVLFALRVSSRACCTSSSARSTQRKLDLLRGRILLNVGHMVYGYDAADDK
jgi:hypothetical protein